MRITVPGFCGSASRSSAADTAARVMPFGALCLWDLERLNATDKDPLNVLHRGRFHSKTGVACRGVRADYRPEHYGRPFRLAPIAPAAMIEQIARQPAHSRRH